MCVQVPVGSEKTAFATSNEARSSSVVRPMSIKNLAPNEILFQVGDPRACLYRVESGSLAIYEPRLNGSHAFIDFAFPGDLLGLGFLNNQTHTARAMAETKVACLPIASMDSLVAGDPKSEAKLEQAYEREFELRRNSLVEFGRRSPIKRVAAFLLALSQVNKREGRDPNVIDASWQCAFVADQLELSLDLLAHILVEFEKRGLIESCPSRGLRLKDLVTLEGLVGEPGTSLLLRDICDCRKRCSCTLAQGQTLLGKGDEARNFYVVESGVLLLEHPASPSSVHQPRILSIGEVFSLDGDGTYIASCEALTDAAVICVDGTSVERLAARDEAVARVPFVIASDRERGRSVYSG
jgi:CRP/FNR family transcriptional regulator